MKQIINGGGGGGCGGGGGGGGLRIPTDDEIEVVEILLNLPKILAKSELLTRYCFTWGMKKKRSVLVSKSESSPSPVKLTVVEADKSPSTPLCFLPEGSGSDGGDKRKPPASVRRNLKRKATDDLVESYNRMQQEREILMRETKAMKTLHQELTSANLGLKAIIQRVKYSRNIDNYHPQITMFVSPTPQHQQHQQHQLVVDPNTGKVVAVPCSGNSHGGGRFGLFNQIDPRVKIQGETYDFMASSQPLDLQIKIAAAAARKRRIMRMKENKNALLSMKVSRGCR